MFTGVALTPGMVVAATHAVPLYVCQVEVEFQLPLVTDLKSPAVRVCPDNFDPEEKSINNKIKKYNTPFCLKQAAEVSFIAAVFP